MIELRWIIFSFFLMLVFGLAAETVDIPVRAGDDVTLSCEIATHDQNACDSTTWLFVGSTKTQPLFENGQIHREADSDRLSVTENCSLVMKTVTAEDVGYYFCKQFKSGKFEESNVRVCVVTMYEHQDADRVTLNCSVLTSGFCGYRIKWLFEDKNVDEDQDMKTSPSKCSVAVTFSSSKHQDSFKCEVTERLTGKVQEFPFSHQSSGWWWFVIVGLVAFLIILLAVVGWRRIKGKKTQTDENKGESSNTAVTPSGPETRHDTADPEDGVSYASVSYTKKTNSKAQVRGVHGDDEGDTVTYSTVKAYSSSAGASTDLNNLYTAVKKPNK